MNQHVVHYWFYRATINSLLAIAFKKLGDNLMADVSARESIYCIATGLKELAFMMRADAT